MIALADCLFILFVPFFTSWEALAEKGHWQRDRADQSVRLLMVHHAECERLLLSVSFHSHHFWSSQLSNLLAVTELDIVLGRHVETSSSAVVDSRLSESEYGSELDWLPHGIDYFAADSIMAKKIW